MVAVVGKQFIGYHYSFIIAWGRQIVRGGFSGLHSQGGALLWRFRFCGLLSQGGAVGTGMKLLSAIIIILLRISC